LDYKFRLALPSLFNLLPGITVAAPGWQSGQPGAFGGRALELKLHKDSRVHAGPLGPSGHPDYLGVRLQSTGPRMRLNGTVPRVYDFDWDGESGGSKGAIWNTPLYWTPDPGDDSEPPPATDADEENPGEGVGKD